MENLDKFILDDTVYETRLTKKFVGRKPYQRVNPNEIRAYIPGVIQKLYVKKGQKVKENEPLLILEAMKMKNDVVASVEGKISEIHIKLGDMVAKNQLLIIIE